MFKNFKQAPKKQYTSEQLKAFKFTDDSLLAIYLDMLDSYIVQYNKSDMFDGQIYFDLCTIRELCDNAYNNEAYADNSMISVSHLKNDSANDIIKNQCKLAIFALMSIN